ncbi:MAG: menaquinone biosynthetic enzyme MqnA/MqnD family protein [Thermodesulfobacteriota bacterium]
MPSQGSVRRDHRAPLRLGRIGFVNVLPVYMHMAQDSYLFRETSGTPSQLDERLARGLLDVSVVSSIEYAFRPEHYLILPDLSISCLGRVRSVLLFSELPMDQWGDGPIQCPMESQTSVALLELLLDGLWGTKRALVLERGWQRPVAFLRIGDSALREMASGKWRYWWDLGQAWFEWTGLPFVFALWLVRREVVERDPQRVAQLHRSLIASRDQGLADLQGCARKAKAILGEDLGLDMEEYFKGLRFNLGPDETKGLERFYLKLAEKGRITSRPPLRFWEAPPQE